MTSNKVSSKASSEAIFGSIVRGDNDSLSDKDILIVDDCISILSARKEVLESEGWSVASYTFKKLKALSDNGALFIQHLKQESSITHDKDNKLSDALRAFKPKHSYHVDLRANLQLAIMHLTTPIVEDIKGHVH